jgi:hypothetical protein
MTEPFAEWQPAVPPNCPTCGNPALDIDALTDDAGCALNRLSFRCAGDHRWEMLAEEAVQLSQEVEAEVDPPPPDPGDEVAP